MMPLSGWIVLSVIYFSFLSNGQLGSGLCSRTIMFFSSATFSGYWFNTLWRSEGSEARLYNS